ncbi:hypothetical protein Tco_0163824 [Tanacetum coccineum]
MTSSHVINHDIPEAESVLKHLLRPGSKAQKDWINELISNINEASGNSGGILCAWDTNFFKKDHHTISDNFIAFYLESLITSWNGESLIMGDFNEVRCIEERGDRFLTVMELTTFNSLYFNSGLNDKSQLEGFTFHMAHPSATK